MNTPTIATEERRRIKQAALDRNMHPSIAHVLQFFHYKHLPPELATVSHRFYELAWMTAQEAPNNQETTVALRKLLEAKDAAVRASLPE